MAISLLFQAQSSISIPDGGDSFIHKEDQQMMYVNSRYLNVARKNELFQHARNMEELQRQVARLSKAVAWELAQHQTRLKELQQLENVLTAQETPSPIPSATPTLEPGASSTRKWVKFRKHTRRSSVKPAAESVR